MLMGFALAAAEAEAEADSSSEGWPMLRTDDSKPDTNFCLNNNGLSALEKILAKGQGAMV